MAANVEPGMGQGIVNPEVKVPTSGMARLLTAMSNSDGCSIVHGPPVLADFDKGNNLDIMAAWIRHRQEPTPTGIIADPGSVSTMSPKSHQILQAILCAYKRTEWE